MVGLLGRFDRVKGQRELIRALGMLRARGLRDIRLLLLGFDSATPEGQVRDWLREAGMEEAAIITGKRNDIPRLLNTLDLGAAPSLVRAKMMVRPRPEAWSMRARTSTLFRAWVR